MKIRLSAILVFAVLFSVFFCGCGDFNEENNQHSTNNAEVTYFPTSNITDDNTASFETKVHTTEAGGAVSDEQVIASGSETVTSAVPEEDSEPTEACTTNSVENPQGEPEIDFSDLI